MGKDAQAIALYGDSTGAVVVRYPYGKGEVVWLAGPTPMTNAGLREPGNFEFLLSLLDEKPNSRILFDEYFHGYRQTLAGSVAHSQLKWFFAQLAVLAVAVLLTFSRRSGPVRPRPAESRLSPLEFVSTLAGLYQRAHASAVAVDVAYQRFRYWTIRRLALPPSASVEMLEQALSERSQLPRPRTGTRASRMRVGSIFFRPEPERCSAPSAGLAPLQSRIEAISSYPRRLKLTQPAAQPESVSRIAQHVREEMGKVILGQAELIDHCLLTLLCRGHALLEGVPGIAKTLTVKALSRLMQLEFQRVQCTSDLMPSDITGTNILQTATGRVPAASRPGVFRPAPGGRGEPHASAYPGRAAGMHGGAPGDD